MINNRHIEHLKEVLTLLIDEIVDIQCAINRGTPSPEEISDFYAAVDFAEARLAGIIYGAQIDLSLGMYEDEE